ncbi:MAG: S46 family peptidase [Candidatus Aminicenantes bacterium]|jgi:hypothetical protein
MKKQVFVVFFLFAFVVLLTQVYFADEGMWPISEINKLNLNAKGLEIPPDEIFSPSDMSLIYAVVQVGATGSFLSPDGLIITNHHVAYRPVQAASTTENDYIKNGFLAKDRSEEIPAKGMTARITESFRDVSKEVLSVVKEGMDRAERTKAIDKRKKEIVAKTEKENPGKRAEVSEMFSGKSYVLFIYTYLRDIRLVYIPPRSIGEFGGDVDNWMWPRHTGDFSFMRAYVAPDGSPADYSTRNIPFRPKRFFQVNADGVKEGDFVFMLGYPGRTFRHQTSHFWAYDEEVRMPYVVDWYGWQIALMEKMGKEDREIALKHLSRIKGLSNTMKNYQGKLRGMKRLSLVEKKREEEKALHEYIFADDDRAAKYGNVIKRMGALAQDMRERAEYELILNYLGRSAILTLCGCTVYEASIEREKADLEREAAYMDRNFSRTKQRLFLSLRNYYEPTDKAVLKEMLKRAAGLPGELRIPAVDAIIKDKNPEKAIEMFVEEAYAKTKLNGEHFLRETFTKSTNELKNTNDPFLRLAEDLYPTYLLQRETSKARKGLYDQLYAQLLDVKQAYLKKDFIPDANRTLRLTYGRIRGYNPRDAVYYNPITTLDGVMEKSTGKEPFDTPQKIFDLYEAKDFGRFAHPQLKSVPVCVLYDMDTTGGNSGSPVLDARGQLVGVNFDRAWEATINDYAWSSSYSRSIGVDIRYILWVTQKFGGVDYLLKEMGVAE